MHSSSAYAAPLELDLRPGHWERALHVIGASSAVSGLLLADLPPVAAFVAVVLVLLLTMREWLRANARPAKLVLYASGDVECVGALWERPWPRSPVRTLPTSNPGASPAILLQSSVFMGLPQLQFADANGHRHACLLFPDRLDAHHRHRLRLWLATHRPSLAVDADTAEAARA